MAPLQQTPSVRLSRAEFEERERRRIERETMFAIGLSIQLLVVAIGVMVLISIRSALLFFVITLTAAAVFFALSGNPRSYRRRQLQRWQPGGGT